MICRRAANRTDLQLGVGPGSYVHTHIEAGEREDTGDIGIRVASEMLWLVIKIAPALRGTGIRQASTNKLTSNDRQHKRPTGKAHSGRPICVGSQDGHDLAFQAHLRPQLACPALQRTPDEGGLMPIAGLCSGYFWMNSEQSTRQQTTMSSFFLVLPQLHKGVAFKSS